MEEKKKSRKIPGHDGEMKSTTVTLTPSVTVSCSDEETAALPPVHVGATNISS